MSSHTQEEAAPVEDEPLGLGATVLSSIFAVLVGGVVGVVTTFTHDQLKPAGLIAGLLIVVALVAGFRLVFESRIVAGAAALGVVGASAILALPGAGGVVLTLGSVPGVIWAVGPAILSVVVLLVGRPWRKGPSA
jgi:N-acetyl-1-D-myo-inositol-2-amino-2-deoxy-alpha-D-glucopyranoside deacetylase